MNGIFHTRHIKRRKKGGDSAYLAGAASVFVEEVFADTGSRTYRARLSNGRTATIDGRIGLGMFDGAGAVLHHTSASAQAIQKRSMT